MLMRSSNTTFGETEEVKNDFLGSAQTLFWLHEFANDVDKINILDSMGNYFNDLYIETNEDGSYNSEDVDAVIKMLEETNLQEMTNFFNATVCKDTKELADVGTDYINIFRVNGKICFVVSD